MLMLSKFRKAPTIVLGLAFSSVCLLVYMSGCKGPVILHTKPDRVLKSPFSSSQHGVEYVVGVQKGLGLLLFDSNWEFRESIGLDAEGERQVQAYREALAACKSAAEAEPEPYIAQECIRMATNFWLNSLSKPYHEGVIQDPLCTYLVEDPYPPHSDTTSRNRLHQEIPITQGEIRFYSSQSFRRLETVVTEVFKERIECWPLAPSNPFPGIQGSPKLRMDLKGYEGSKTRPMLLSSNFIVPTGMTTVEIPTLNGKAEIWWGDRKVWSQSYLNEEQGPETLPYILFNGGGLLLVRAGNVFSASYTVFLDPKARHFQESNARQVSTLREDVFRAGEAQRRKWTIQQRTTWSRPTTPRDYGLYWGQKTSTNPSVRCLWDSDQNHLFVLDLEQGVKITLLDGKDGSTLRSYPERPDPPPLLATPELGTALAFDVRRNAVSMINPVGETGQVCSKKDHYFMMDFNVSTGKYMPGIGEKLNSSFFRQLLPESPQGVRAFVQDLPDGSLVVMNSDGSERWRKKPGGGNRAQTWGYPGQRVVWRSGQLLTLNFLGDGEPTLLEENPIQAFWVDLANGQTHPAARLPLYDKAISNRDQNSLFLLTAAKPPKVLPEVLVYSLPDLKLKHRLRMPFFDPLTANLKVLDIKAGDGFIAVAWEQARRGITVSLFDLSSGLYSGDVVNHPYDKTMGIDVNRAGDQILVFRENHEATFYSVRPVKGH